MQYGKCERVLGRTVCMMRIEIRVSDGVYRLLERAVAAFESIDQTLKGTAEDFSREDASVKATTEDVMSAEHAVHDAQERIPH